MQLSSFPNVTLTLKPLAVLKPNSYIRKGKYWAEEFQREQMKDNALTTDHPTAVKNTSSSGEE